MHILKVKKLSKTAAIPSYAHPGDAGMDLFSDEELTIRPGEFKVVKTGIAILLPTSTEAQVRPRSGLAAKHGITVLNTPGTIDEGYRGEIGVILINHSKVDFAVTRGMKIAQMVIAPVVRAAAQEADELDDSSRGTGGFGSTGV
jgi:dUTP pyrophosphatase